MKPTIGKRASNYHREEEKPKSIARQYVELNTHKNIVIKREFLYLEDIKSAININTLEERIKIERWVLSQPTPIPVYRLFLNTIFHNIA